MDKRTRNKSLLVVVVVLIVLTYLLPTNKVVRYDFIIGQEWDGEALIAPFDIPIYKTERDYLAEVEGYEKTFVPVYRVDKELETLIDNTVNNDFNVMRRDRLTQSSDSLRSGLTEQQKFASVLKSTVKELYDIGILHSKDIPQMSEFEKERITIRVLDDDELSVRLVSNFYDSNSALKFLNERLKSSGFNRSYISQYTLEKYLRPNILYDENLSTQLMDESVRKISETRGFESEGTVIIRDGEIISPKIAKILEDLNREYIRLGAHNTSLLPYIGNFLYMLLIILISSFTLLLLFKEEPLRLNGVLFISMLYCSLAFLCSVISKFPVVSIYVIPFAIVPFYLSEFFKSRVAVVQYVFVLLMCAMYAPVSFEFIVCNLVAGITGMYFLQKSYRRNTVFRAVLVTIASYIVIYLAFTFMRQQQLVVSDLYMILWFSINGALLLVLLQLTFVFEKMFHFVTKITLVELCDTNQKLLKELSSKAPGTFQHSLQVANIVEEATNAIGGNVLLARAGVMYHDIGKMTNPLYFVENQRSDGNIHDGLPPEESAKIINHHVLDGAILAKKHNLPVIVADFITTHHGDSLIRFFYHKEVQRVGEENVDINSYKYSGPPPFTKEQTILMISDAVEAASRTLKSYDRETVTGLINAIVEGQQSMGQYRNSPLSFMELEKIKEAIINKVLDIYHTRIEYPKIK